jgi:DNA-binding NarL/FixJ family response regulator
MTPPRKRASRAGSRGRKKHGGRGITSLDDLVRAGVERFVLKEASMMSFQKAIRAAAKRGLTSAHPLTGAAFRRIVREAVHERATRRKRAFRRRSKPGRERSA